MDVINFKNLYWVDNFEIFTFCILHVTYNLVFCLNYVLFSIRDIYIFWYSHNLLLKMNEQCHCRFHCSAWKCECYYDRVKVRDSNLGFDSEVNALPRLLRWNETWRRRGRGDPTPEVMDLIENCYRSGLALWLYILHNSSGVIWSLGEIMKGDYAVKNRSIYSPAVHRRIIENEARLVLFRAIVSQGSNRI